MCIFGFKNPSGEHESAYMQPRIQRVRSVVFADVQLASLLVGARRIFRGHEPRPGPIHTRASDKAYGSMLTQNSLKLLLLQLLLLILLLLLLLLLPELSLDAGRYLL